MENSRGSNVGIAAEMKKSNKAPSIPSYIPGAILPERWQNRVHYQTLAFPQVSRKKYVVLCKKTVYA